MNVTARKPRRWPRVLLRVVLALAVLLLVLVLALVVVALRNPPQAADPRLAHRASPAPAIDTAPAGGKPVLILLHGAGLNARMWKPVIRHLDPRWRVLALDLPGYGVRGDEDYTVEAARRAVVDAAARVAPAQVIVAGDSLGGYSAMVAAAALPQAQLRGLVVSGASANFPAHPGFVDWAQRLFIRLLVMRFGGEALGERALTKVPFDAADARAIAAGGMHVEHIERTVDALLGVDFVPVLAAIPQPVLFVNGDLDERAMAGEAGFVAATPHASVYNFKASAHGVSILHPDGFARLLDTFASEHFDQATSSGPAP